MTEEHPSRGANGRKPTDERADTAEVPIEDHQQHAVDAEVTQMLASMSPRQRRKQLRAYRKQAKRQKWMTYRDTWVDQQIDRSLPDTVDSKLPPWVHTKGGRWTIIGCGLLAMLFWTLLVVLLIV